MDVWAWDRNLYAVGGGVLGFIKDFPKDLTLSLRWHMVANMAEALLFLFKIEEVNDLPASAPQSLEITHGDIFVGSTLLGKPDIHDANGFSTCVLADFGRAKDTDGEWPESLEALSLQTSRMRGL